ncbi:MAG: hypothetical protein ABI868_15550 [Acidobacteriota bacterium]
MTRVRGLTRQAVMLLLAAAATAPLAAQEPDLKAVMQRAGVYVAGFRRQLSSIAAEESYVQEVRPLIARARSTAIHHRRELRSDFLLVWPAGADRYVELRDVFEVDGQPVRDRQERLTALLRDQPTAAAGPGIQRIIDESARYNIGTIERNVNTPTLPLLFLEPDHQARFRFRRGADRAPAITRTPRDPSANFTTTTEVWVVEYEEVQRKTLIRTTSGRDIPVRGRFWIEPATGRVLMSELTADSSAVRATIDVSYQSEPLLGFLVPIEMRERYEGRRDGTLIEGNATYGNFRPFQLRPGP